MTDTLLFALMLCAALGSGIAYLCALLVTYWEHGLNASQEEFVG